MSMNDTQALERDLVCSKLRLRASKTLLDIGFDWGALIIHTAKLYGVQATGVT